MLNEFPGKLCIGLHLNGIDCWMEKSEAKLTCSDVKYNFAHGSDIHFMADSCQMRMKMCTHKRLRLFQDKFIRTMMM